MGVPVFAPLKTGIHVVDGAITEVITATDRKHVALIRLLFYWGPLAVWLVLSLLLATALGGYNNTVSLIYRVLTFLSPETLSPGVNQMYGVTHVVRRAAYILEYGTLALLLMRAVQAGEPTLKRRNLLAVAGGGVLFVLLENGVRVLTPGRHGGWDDVVLSLTNVGFFTGLTYAFFAAKAWERKYFAGKTDFGRGAVQ